MRIDLTSGHAVIRDRVTHGVQKKIQAALGATMHLDAGDERPRGTISMEAVTAANDAALLAMIIELEVDGQAMPVTQETIDNLPEGDVVKIIKAIDELGKGDIDPKA